MENSNDVLNGFSAFSASMAGTPGESSSASSTLGSIYDRNGFKSFVLYGAMRIGVGLCSSNYICINSIKCICTDTN